jgi:hypothetical protein
MALGGKWCFLPNALNESSLGGKFWAENTYCPYTGTADIAQFKNFSGYEYKKRISPEI